MKMQPNRRYFRIFLTLTAFFFVPDFHLFSQPSVVSCDSVPDLFCRLPKKVNETSGLIWFRNAIWTFNDSGGDPQLYRIESGTGKIAQTITLKNGQNVDWEDITQDDSCIYIGDFGNNRGIRRDLTVYKIAKAEIPEDKDTFVKADRIDFSYADQDQFEENNRSHNFDCESIISFGDSLILFTKNWGNGKTRMYRLPATAGRYSLKPLSEFQADGLITGACFHSVTRHLALLGYQFHVPFLLLFKDFNGKSFDSPEIVRIKLSGMAGAQTEGACWLDDHRLVISNEERKEFQQGVYLINLETLLEDCQAVQSQ